MSKIQIINHTYFIPLFLCLLAITLSDAPLPKCFPGFYYQTLPLIGDEASIINLDRLFDGYNLTYTLQGADNFKQSLTLKDKIILQKRQVPDQPLIGLKSCHLQKFNNVWGSTFIALVEKGVNTYVHYGVLNSNTSAPVVNNIIQMVNKAPNTSCFDAVLFPQKDLILVDCATKLTLPNGGQTIKNIIYYYKLSDGSNLPSMQTEMYVDFTSITNRKLQIYTDNLSKHTFLLRAYLENGVDIANSPNTYVDIFMITDPQHPWVVDIIDRTFLRATSLRIRDIKIYLGEIYILDSQKGLYRVRITTQQELELLGHYDIKGYTQFDVYSNNLDDSFELVLANQRGVYEVDWSIIQEPRIINKYTLMEESKVLKVIINNRFVIVHATSQLNATQYNYTWIFTRGSRTYTSAFLTIAHNTTETFIDLNQQMSYLIVVDPIQMSNYALDASNLLIKFKYNPDIIDKMYNFTIKAISKDSLNPQEVSCSIKINFTVLEDNNRTMWPIGINPPQSYIANYPGRVVIPLYQYVIGPNITYRIRDTQQGQIKRAKVYQNQQLRILWENPPPKDVTMTFLKSEIMVQGGRDVVIIYLQDNKNVTYISYCLPDHEAIDVYCNETSTFDLQAQLTNWVTTNFLSKYSMKTFHIIAYTTTRHLNRIYIIYMNNIQEIQLGSGFAGQISSIEMTGRYLLVSLKYIKTVQVYDLELCIEGLCQPIYNLNHLSMYNLGVKFFSPLSIHTSIYHRQVIFIKSADSVMAVDIDKEGVPLILGTIRPVPNAESEFGFKMNANSMIVTIYPSTVIEYDLSRLYYRQIVEMKKYPLYGLKMPKDYTIDTSDYGNCVFLSTVNEGGDYIVYVYRSGLPAVGSLLNLIDLNNFNTILMDSTGSNVDYLTVVTKQEIRMYRQHQLPLAQVDSVQKDFKFYLQYSNAAASATLEMIQVQIINLPTYINVNPFVNNIMNTRNLLYSGHNILSQINDTDWYTGNVLTIKPDCRDCNGVVSVLNHINLESKQKLVPSLTEYEWNVEGGVIQQINNIIGLFNNGSVKNIATIPNIDGDICYTVAVTSRGHYYVSGCVGVEGINLYLISMVSHKPYVFSKFASGASSMLRLEAVNELIMLVDSNSNPFFKTRGGGVIIYAIDEEIGEESSLIELQYFDANDLGDITIPVIYIVNAHLTYSRYLDSYKLYMTDIIRGVFIIQFTYDKHNKDISILQVNSINIPKILAQQNRQIPYDATYQAVTVIDSVYNLNTTTTNQKIMVTTGVFHTLQFDLTFGKSGVISSIKLTKVYLRYAFYVVDNYVKASNGLFVVRHSLPHQFDNGTLNKQLLTVYDCRGQFNGTVEQRGLIGAYLTNDTLLHSFDFNFTINDTDIHGEPRMGLVMVESFADSYLQLSLHRNLSVYTTQEVDTQIIYLDLINDFTLKKIRILLNGKAPFPEWLIIAIVLGSVIGLGILSVVVYVVVKKVRERSGVEDQEGRESLMTQNN